MVIPLIAGLLAATAAPGAGDSHASVREFIALMPWDTLRECPGVLTIDEAARGMKECGLNLAGMVRGQHLDVCHRHGLRALVKDPRVSGYDWRNVDPEQVDRNIRELVAEVGSHPAVFGYYVKDEPSAQEFPGLAVVVKALAKYAPGKLAYINLFPDYATINNADRVGQLGTESYEEYLDRFIESVPTPVVSYDNYSIEKDYTVRPSYYRNLLSVRRAALEGGRIFWNVVTSNQVRPFRASPTRASLAFQAHTTLAAGGRGVAYYTNYTGDDTLPGAGGYAHGPLWNFRPTPTWEYLRDVNHGVQAWLPVLARLESTGVYFGPNPPVDGLPALPGRIVAGVESDRPTMVGEFADPKGAAYTMVVNLDLTQEARALLTLREGFQRPQQILPVRGRAIPLPSEGLRLEPGGAALIQTFRKR